MNHQAEKSSRKEDAIARTASGTDHTIPTANQPRRGEPNSVTEPSSAELLRGESLDQLAAGIMADHAAVERFARTTLDHARRAGERLKEAKSRLPHGEFKRWIARYVSVSYRTCRRYLRIAKEWHQLETKMATGGHFGLREAEGLIVPKKLPGPKLPTSTTVESVQGSLALEERRPDKSSKPLLEAIERLSPGRGLLVENEIRLGERVFEDNSAAVMCLGPGLGYQLAAITFSHDLNRGKVHWLRPTSALEGFNLLAFLGFAKGKFELVEEIQPHLDEFHGIWKRCEPEKGSADSARLEILQEYHEILTRGEAKSPASAARLKYLEDQLRRVNDRIRHGAV